jgi:peptide/nickel transport system permease protein
MQAQRDQARVVGLAHPLGRTRRLLPIVGGVLRRNPNILVGLAVLLVMATASLFAPFLTPLDPVKTNPEDRLHPPSATYWFGTDHVGRDVYARTVYGGRISLVVGLAVSATATVIGSVIGLIAGYYRMADNIIMRFMDGIMAFPALLLALALIALLGASMTNVIIAISVVTTPTVVRVVRASVLSLREQDFVQAARALGASAPRILALHVFPNTVAPLLVQGTYIFAVAVLNEASLSFLGAGTPPVIPSWGNMMGQGRLYVQTAVWIIFFPGLFLALTVLAINMLGDGLRDILDPKVARRK